MNTIEQLLRRDSSSYSDDDSYNPVMSPLAFAFSTLVVIAAIGTFTMLFLRRKRFAREQATLPVYRHPSHHRSVSVSNFPTTSRNEAIFVYDEKMNLISNSSTPPSSSLPEIHITFPDEEDNCGERQKGRVVVVHVTDSGSVGMSPLGQDTLPPYQRSDAERFQSLDLERIGGLREKEQRWS